MPIPRLPEDPMRFVALYQKGIWTALEFAGAVVAAVTEANVILFLDGCPADLLPGVLARVTRCPPDDNDAEWAALVSIGGGNPRSRFTEAELHQMDVERHQAFRNGVRVLRRAIAHRPDLSQPHPDN